VVLIIDDGGRQHCAESALASRTVDTSPRVEIDGPIACVLASAT